MPCQKNHKQNTNKQKIPPSSRNKRKSKPGMFSMTCKEKDFNDFSGNIPKPNQHR